MDFTAKQEVQVPLLVKIQTIEVENLDFRSSIAKNKHVTYIDGTSRFLIVGCTSGSVYVFSRDSLKFLFIIPFKGGKVCGISCAEDETDVAVGSIRGKVSIYRLLNLESNKSPENSASSPVPCTVKHLYAVTHHTNNEITEMLWSPNGRYLFVGDSQGLISQVDVGSLDEFPRPPPSRIILQVQSRVLQMDCIFPYLAINTVNGAFLCDIENEDFTRLQNPERRSSHLQSSGICLMHSPDRKTSPQVHTEDSSSSISLYVAGKSATVHRYGMQGNLLENFEIQENFILQNEVHLFDPKKSPVLTETQTPVSMSDFKNSFGKLITCDEGYIISATNDRILIIDPCGMKIILWNDSFRKICNIKILSNYLFIWEIGKFHVLALTSFRAYGDQLLRANLHSVLENWIQHALNVVGWRKELEEEILQEDEQEQQHARENIDKSSNLLQSMIRPLSSSVSASSDDDEFTNFVVSHIPKSMADKMYAAHVPENVSNREAAQEKSKIVSALTKLTNSLQQLATSNSLEESSNGELEVSERSSGTAAMCASNALLTTLVDFYDELDVKLPQNMDNDDEDSVIYKQSLFQNKMTLDSLIQSGIWFLQQDRLKLIEIECQSCAEFIQLKENLTLIISYLHQKECWMTEDVYLKLEQDANFPQLFTKFINQNSVTKWLTDFSCPMLAIKNDAYLAELVLLLAPLIQWIKLQDLFKESLQYHSQRFFTWLVLLFASRENRTFPYEQRLSNFLVEKLQPHNINEVISYVYEDLELESDIHDSKVKYLHHFATVLYFKAMTNKNARNKILSSLITNFPLKGRADDEIKEKVTHLCRRGNTSLLTMYQEACLTDGNSQELCLCGIPNCFGIPSFFMIPKTQRLIEEVILEILVLHPDDNDSQHEKPVIDPKLKKSLAFSFAMQRLLFDNYFQLSASSVAKTTSDLDDELKTSIIFRTAQCNLLQKYFPFTWSRLQLVRDLYNKLLLDPRGKENCHGCGAPLKTLPSYKIISWDCLGLWILGGCSLNETERLTQVLQLTESLNRPGIFSLRFYQLLARSEDGDYDDYDEEEEDLVLLRHNAGMKNKNTTLCAALH